MLVFGDVEASTWPPALRAATTEISRSNGMKASRIADLVRKILPDLIGIVSLADDRLALAVIAEAAGFDHRGQADLDDRGPQCSRRGDVGVVGGTDTELP